MQRPMRPDDTLIRTVEIAAARAWPATETAAAGGWLLRHTPALDRARNNAALPPPSRPAGVPGALDDVIAWYVARGARPQVQVSPLAWHAPLDAELAARGWEVAYGADVLVATPHTTNFARESSHGEDSLAKFGARVEIAGVADAAWLEAWSVCEERDRASVAAHAEAVFGQLAPRAVYATARDGSSGAAVAVGLAVHDPGIAGIFCMATHPEHRRRGHAGRVLRALAQDAATRGAHTLYLQVDSRNTSAGGLYAAHGFRRSHRYHFRRARA